jgi:hypothetical protein
MKECIQDHEIKACMNSHTIHVFLANKAEKMLQNTTEAYLIEFYEDIYGRDKRDSASYTTLNVSSYNSQLCVINNTKR